MRRLIVIAIILQSVMFGIAQELKFAPLNPEYRNYLEYIQADQTKKSYAENPFEFIPSPLYLNFENNAANGPLSEAADSENILPSRFDLRDSGFVTPVKNQKPGGTCWAHAALGAVESNWLLNNWGTYDLSEQNMVTCNGINKSFNCGGNGNIPSAYLTRLSGPVLESDDPYEVPDGYGLLDTLCKDESFEIPRYVLTSLYLPACRDIIKSCIMKYGGVTTAMRWHNENSRESQDDYYNSEDYTFYYKGGHPIPEHVVLLVGWDDEKIVTGGFKSPKGTRGAWIVKNSYGTEFGDEGYFYLSYNDNAALSQNYLFDESVEVNEIDKINLNDDLGATSSIGFDSCTVAYGLTKFNAPSEEIITKVGTYINSSSTAIEFQIFNEFKDGILTGLVFEKIDSSLFPGQRVFSAFAKVKGDYYIKMKYSTPGNFYPIPVESEVSGFMPPMISPVGYNWISMDGENWQDIGEGIPGKAMDLTIRSYTIDLPMKPWGNFELPGDKICMGKPLILRAELCDTGINCKWEFLPDGSCANDTCTGNVCAEFSSPGEKIIRLVITDNTGCDTITKSIEVVSGLEVQISHNFTHPDDYNFTCYPNTPRVAMDKLIRLTASVNMVADSFKWNYPYDTLNNSSILVAPEHIGSNLYSVTVKNGTCTGSDTLSVEGFIRPINDDVKSAIKLNLGVNGPFSNVNAGVETGEPQPPLNDCLGEGSWCPQQKLERSVWFCFNAPNKGPVYIKSYGIDTKLAAYVASSPGRLLEGKGILLNANDNIGTRNLSSEIILNDLVPNGRYWIQVDGGDCGMEGEFYIRVSGPKYLLLGEDSIYLEPQSGDFAKVNIDANSTWSVGSYCDWIDFTPGSSSDKDTLTITAKSKNDSDTLRIDSLRVTTENNMVVKIWIFQKFPGYGVGIEKKFNRKDIKIYPNPGSSEIFVSGLDKSQKYNCTYTINDISGREIKIIPSRNEAGIDISDLSNGLYFLRIMEDDGQAVVLRFIKE